MFHFHKRLEKGIDISEILPPGKTEKGCGRGNPYDDFFEAKLNQWEDGEKKAEGEKSGRDENQRDERKGDKKQLPKEGMKNGDRPVVRTAIDDKVKELPRQELNPNDRDSFQGGNYHTVETTENLVLYRVYGEKAGKCGRFLTTEKPTDRMTAKMEMALLPHWANSRQYFCEVEIPKGTILNIGKCERQEIAGGGSLPGGIDQILVSQDFVNSNPDNYKEEHLLEFAGNYHLFEKMAKKIEHNEVEI